MCKLLSEGQCFQPNATLRVNKTELVGNNRILHKLPLLNFNGMKYLSIIYSALKHWINGQHKSTVHN